LRGKLDRPTHDVIAFWDFKYPYFWRQSLEAFQYLVALNPYYNCSP
jgi:hypothetical protein